MGRRESRGRGRCSGAVYVACFGSLLEEILLEEYGM